MASAVPKAYPVKSKCLQTIDLQGIVPCELGLLRLEPIDSYRDSDYESGYRVFNFSIISGYDLRFAMYFLLFMFLMCFSISNACFINAQKISK